MWDKFAIGGYKASLGLERTYSPFKRTHSTTWGFKDVRLEVISRNILSPDPPRIQKYCFIIDNKPTTTYLACSISSGEYERSTFLGIAHTPRMCWYRIIINIIVISYRLLK